MATDLVAVPLDTKVMVIYVERNKIVAFCVLKLQGTPCDLVTGEERKFSQSNGDPSNHVSCTVEMTSINVPCM
jgi:hypothetical protein